MAYQSIQAAAAQTWNRSSKVSSASETRHSLRHTRAVAPGLRGSFLRLVKPRAAPQRKSKSVAL